MTSYDVINYKFVSLTKPATGEKHWGIPNDPPPPQVARVRYTNQIYKLEPPYWIRLEVFQSTIK